MKRIRIYEYGEPEVMRCEDAPDPVPAAGEVLVRMEAVGVNPVDTYMRAGAQGYSPQLPWTPGLDGGGTVVDLGKGVEGLSRGDRVFVGGTLSGSYAGLALCRPEQLGRLPEWASFAQGAALGIPYATAYRALFHKAAARPGETVIIHGASGGVGLAALQLAVRHGLRVIATAGSAEGLALVRAQGAWLALSHREHSRFQAVMEATGGRGVDIVLEMLANVNLGRDLTMLARGARLVVIGSRGEVEITPRELMRREASLIGMTLPGASAEERREILLRLEALLEARAIDPVVAREFPLTDAPAAHRAVMEDPHLGKIVLRT